MARPIFDGLARTVRQLRRARGWTRADLSRRSGVSPRFLSEIEAARANLSLQRLCDLATALETTPSALLSGSIQPTPKVVVALLGLRGAGKSTVGAKLAATLQCPFIELDARVEDRAGLRLTEIFQLHGDAFYRRLELEALSDLLAHDTPAVVATGGGVVTVPEAREALRRRAHTVWLRARPEDHWSRVAAQGDTRPMANDERAFQNLCSLLEERAPLYGQADLVVDTSGRTPDAIVRQLASHFAFLGV
jgi:XRE family aerobic/anaerobic benzoate catabolism transcriptional regulator